MLVEGFILSRILGRIILFLIMVQWNLLSTAEAAQTLDQHLIQGVSQNYAISQVKHKPSAF